MIINAPIPQGYGTGLIPRDYSAFPVGCMAFAPEFPESEIYPESEWADRLAEQKANKASLLDMREANYETLKSLNQARYGLCWAFSTTKAVMYTRALANADPMILSAWYVAGMIKNWRDEGGWGSASLDFVVNKGVPEISKCPSYSRGAVAPDAAANAELQRVTEWWDGSEDPRKATRQLVSCLLKAIPCVVDLNDMGHSMCAIAIEKLNPLTIVYDNSWGDQGDKGLYYGTGARARPDGLVIPRVSIASKT